MVEITMRVETLIHLEYLFAYIQKKKNMEPSKGYNALIVDYAHEKC